MAAYEVLLLNTAIPQIQAAQSGDTYVVPRDIAFSTVANLANGTYLLPSLTFSSDPDTGVFRQGANALGFTAGGGSDQMVLTTTGLGIGTNNPAYKLDVVGTGSIISATRSDTNRADIIVTNSGGTVSFGINNSTGSWLTNGLPYYGYILGPSSASYGLQFGVGTSNTAALTIDPSGNLGLGVTPSAFSGFGKTMEFNNAGCYVGNSGATSMQVGANNYFDGTNYIYSTTNVATRYAQSAGSHLWFTALSGTADGTAATSLTSVQNGNSYTIKVAGTTDFTLIGAANNNVGTVFTKSGGTGAGTGTVSQNISFTQAMTLLANGNLGVGETNPGFKLQVIGTSQMSLSGAGTQQALQLNNNDTTAGTQAVKLAFSSTSVTKASINAAVYGNDYMTFNVGSDTERARITSGGEFLVGPQTTVNSEKFNVTGSVADFVTRLINSNATPQGLVVRYSGATPNSNTAYAYYFEDSTLVRFYVRSDGGIGNYQANDANLSDKRLKTDVQPASSYLDKICAIPVKTFLYKDQTDTERNLGVMAQDVDAIAPELIDHSGFGQTPEGESPYLAVYQTDLQYALMKCIQELKSELDSVKAELATLKGA